MFPHENEIKIRYNVVATKIRYNIVATKIPLRATNGCGLGNQPAACDRAGSGGQNIRVSVARFQVGDSLRFRETDLQKTRSEAATLITAICCVVETISSDFSDCGRLLLRIGNK